MKHISESSAVRSLQVLSSAGRSVSKIASRISTLKLFSNTSCKLPDQPHATADKLAEGKKPLEQRMQDRLKILKRLDSLAKPKPRGPALARLRKMKERRAIKLETLAIKRCQINSKRADNFAKLQKISSFEDKNVCKRAYNEAKSLAK